MGVTEFCERKIREIEMEGVHGRGRGRKRGGGGEKSEEYKET